MVAFEKSASCAKPAKDNNRLEIKRVVIRFGFMLKGIYSKLNKTKEELIKELQELRHENDFLKALWDTDITEPKKAEEMLHMASVYAPNLIKTASIR